MNRNRYILTGFLFIFAFIVFEHYVLKPKMETMRETIGTRYLVLLKYEHFLRGKVSTEEEIRSVLSDMETAEKRLIHEKSEFLAAARLQSTVMEFTDKAHLTVLSVRPMSVVKNDKFLTIPLYVAGNGSIKQVADFLKYVEESSVLMKVDKLNLNITNVQDPRDLKFTVQVSGMARP